MKVLYLYILPGPIVLVSLLVLGLLIPVNAYISHVQKSLVQKSFKIRDERVKQTSEVINGIKVTKHSYLSAIPRKMYNSSSSDMCY